jgi:hypothetical protein
VLSSVSEVVAKYNHPLVDIQPTSHHFYSKSKIPPCGGQSQWVFLGLNCAELSVQLGAGFSLFHILNIECRTRNFEQQKFLKAVRQSFLLRYSAVPCSAVHILAYLITDS